MAVQSKAGSDSQADINLPVEDQDAKYENTPPPSITVLCQQQSTQNTYYHDVVNGTKDNPIS